LNDSLKSVPLSPDPFESPLGAQTHFVALHNHANQWHQDDSGHLPRKRSLVQQLDML